MIKPFFLFSYILKMTRAREHQLLWGGARGCHWYGRPWLCPWFRQVCHRWRRQEQQRENRVTSSTLFPGPSLEDPRPTRARLGSPPCRRRVSWWRGTCSTCSHWISPPHSPTPASLCVLMDLPPPRSLVWRSSPRK